MRDNIGFKFAYSTLDKNTLASKVLLGVIYGKNSIKDGLTIIYSLPIVSDWYSVIAEKNNVGVESSEVAEAYWIGNDLLDKEYSSSDIKKITDKANNPEIESKIIPHHNFHVRNFGIISNSQANSEKIESCKVMPVEIIYSPDTAISLVDDKKYDNLKNPFEFELHKGIKVAIHRNTICSVLIEDSVNNLKKYGFNK